MPRADKVRGSLPLKRCGFLLSLITLATVAAFGGTSCSGKPESISVAYSPFEPTALIWIAEDRQLFSRNGLAVTFTKYDTGPAALDGVLSGQADIAAGIGEFPIVGKAFKKEQARVLATIDRSELIKVVARKDRGIQEPADLRGKRVGTTVGTIAEFFLGRFLEINGMSMGDITLVDVRTPDEWVSAVADGTIDAIATAEPYASSAESRLGSNALAWSAHGNQLLFGLVVTTDVWADTNSDLAEKFLESLAQAEEYAVTNPAQAQAIVQERLDLTAASMPAVWSRNQFSLSLDQALLVAMEDEARWMIRNDLTAEKHIPAFLDYIDEDALKEIRPEAIDIIR